MTKRIAFTAQLDAAHRELAVCKAELAGVYQQISTLTSKQVNLRDAADRVAKERDDTRKQFADLKERLYNAEMENQRLRGYIQRVQEDDTVREELVLVGDPGGECQQVPKRKSTVFNSPTASIDFEQRDRFSAISYGGEERKKPKHWITY